MRRHRHEKLRHDASSPKSIDSFRQKGRTSLLQITDADVQVQEGAPEEDYVNFNCWTTGKVFPIWQRIKQLFAEQPALKTATIVCCTGDCGWDDYLLLHTAYEGATLDVLEG